MYINPTAFFRRLPEMADTKELYCEQYLSTCDTMHSCSEHHCCISLL